MPNWKKLITSGSDATLNSLNVTSGVTGSLFGTASYATQALTASFATTASFALNAGATINTGSFATTGSNMFVGNQSISGSLAQGVSTQVVGVNSHAEGSSTIASGDYSHAEGFNSLASGLVSHAEGFYTTASGNYSHAEGAITKALGSFSHTEGASTIALGSYSHVEGFLTIASGSYSHAEGSGSIASGIGSHAEGDNTIASGSHSHAEGYSTISSEYYSHAEGYGTQAIGIASHAEGIGTSALGNVSHAEGYNTTASGDYSHTEGSDTTTLGYSSHAEGQYTTTSGSYSHAEGYNTISSGSNSHAEGDSTQTIGIASHAEGSNTIAFGTGSHAEGFYTIASGDYQHVQGQFNISSSNAGAFIIGNGTDISNRSNLVFASGSQFQITGSLNVSGSITGSLLGTASYATQALTASFALNAGATINTGSFATTGSNSFIGNQTITGSFTVITGSNIELQVLNTGVRLGNVSTDAHTVTGSLGVSGSLDISSNFNLPNSWLIQGNANEFLIYRGANRFTVFPAGGANVMSSFVVGSSVSNVTGLARLTVRGSGNTSSTITTRIENLNTSASFIVQDDRAVLVPSSITIGSSTTGSSILNVSGSTNLVGDLSVTGSFTVITGSNIELQVLNTGVRLGNIVTDAHTVTGSLGVSGSLIITGSGANTLSIIGSGSGIASNTIQARNGAGTTLFTVRNDGKTVIGSNSGSTASGVLTIFQGGSTFANGINFQTTANDANQFGIGASSTSIIQMGFNAGYWNVVGNRLGSSLVSLDTNGYGTFSTGLYGSGIDVQGTYTNPGGSGFGNAGGRGGNSFVDSAIVTVNASSTNTLAQYATLFANRTVTITGSQLPISSIVLNNTYNQTQAVSSGSIIGINHMPVLTSAYNYRAFDFGNTTAYTPNAAVTDYVWSRISSNISASVNNQFIVGLDIILSGSNSSFTGVRRSALRLTTQNSSDAALTAVGTVIITGSLIVTGGITGSLSGSSGGGAAFPFTGSAGISGSLSVNGPISGSYVRLSGSFNTAASGSILTVIGSGSAQPIFTVQGSQGELFSVTDSLSGSLFSVNDISGLPILEVFSDNTVLIGDYQDPMLLTTKKVIQTNSGSFVIYSIPTSSYDGVFIDYTIKSGSNARAGTIMSTWANSSIQFSEVDTMDIGNTAVVGLTMILSGSNAVMTGSSSTGSWTIRTIIRAV